jgi:hypothetical protein
MTPDEAEKRFGAKPARFFLQWQAAIMCDQPDIGNGWPMKKVVRFCLGLLHPEARGSV